MTHIHPYDDTHIPTTHKKYNRIMNSVTLRKPHGRKSLGRLWKRKNDSIDTEKFA